MFHIKKVLRERKGDRGVIFLLETKSGGGGQVRGGGQGGYDLAIEKGDGAGRARVGIGQR